MEMKRVEEGVFKSFGFFSVALVISCLLIMVFTVVLKGLPALNIEMVTQTPRSGFYIGGGGGVLNAIVGSLYLALGGTALAFAAGLPTAVFLQNEYYGRTRAAEALRLLLDILWGIPSIVYGAFGFVIMLSIGVGASLLAGIITLAFVIFPIMTRSIDEMLRTVPADLKEVSYAVGATRLETTLSVTLRQAAPGILTGVILSFGRAIGDAAAIMFTAGFSDRVPSSLFSPAASLTLAIFLQFNTPYPAVQARAYASAIILLALILSLTSIAKYVGKITQRNVIH